MRFCWFLGIRTRAERRSDICASHLRSPFGSAMVLVAAKLLLPFLAALTALAAPVDNVDSSDSPTTLAGITPMTSTQVHAFKPYTYYASAGYCNPSVTKTWTCGANCNANPGFRPIASGGDGSSTQFCSWAFFYDSLSKAVLTVGLIRVCRL